MNATRPGNSRECSDETSIYAQSTVLNGYGPACQPVGFNNNVGEMLLAEPWNLQLGSQLGQLRKLHQLGR